MCWTSVTRSPLDDLRNIPWYNSQIFLSFWFTTILCPRKKCEDSDKNGESSSFFCFYEQFHFDDRKICLHSTNFASLKYFFYNSQINYIKFTTKFKQSSIFLETKFNCHEKLESNRMPRILFSHQMISHSKFEQKAGKKDSNAYTSCTMKALEVPRF